MRPYTARHPFPVATAALALLLAIACDNQPLPTAPPAATRPALDIADATRDYKRGFYWLPPMVKQPAYTGVFDADLSPTVEICELAGDACAAIIATYSTTTGTGGELVRLNADEQQYHVNWHTNSFDLATTKFYRISVRAGMHATLLGYADVQSVTNGSGLKKVDTDEYIGLVDGRTLPIKFRIETGIVGSLRVEPAEAEVEPGMTRQFAAIVRDLHDNIIDADVRWYSSAEAIATVDQNGLATAIDEGLTTITAIAERASGSATLTVDRIVGSVEVQPVAPTVEPGATQQFTAIVRDRQGNIMTADVMWSSSNQGVATINETGLASAIDEGATTITATAEGVSGIATLTVDRIVGSVEIQPIEAEAEPGATQQFVAIVRDRQGNIMIADVTWASSNEAVATVSQTGLATAIADGEATITATAEGISQTATLRVEGGVVAVSAGRGHACALNPDGRAFCWGSNDQGQLGIGVLGNRISPVAVSGGLTFAVIASGDFHTCGITLPGQAYCWGNNQSGELGDGSLVRRLTPVPVSGGLAFVSISTGARNTCALTAANQAYCWGEGGFGALGNGSTARATSPQLVSGGHAFVSISAGQQAACGVTASGFPASGVGYCWGNGGSGKLGNGSTANQFTPVAVSGGLTFSSIQVGDNHTCGVTTAGAGYCWGLGQFGRLGNGGVANASTPQPVSGGLVFAQISAGGLHTCGVTTTGQGYCWGGNVEGSLGTGSGLSRSTPGAVVGGLTWISISASGLIPPDFGGSSQFAFTCGVSVANQTYCWGSGLQGQLGNGSTLSRGSPTAVAAFP
jgi:alpha-tubulin suppressor-like RCC1 family protein/uncharacterized protein YjdB